MIRGALIGLAHDILVLPMAVVSISACGPSWTDLDARDATHTVRLSIQVEQACAAGQTCNAPQVRALERAQYCNGASQLQRHGQPVPDAGVACQAQ